MGGLYGGEGETNYIDMARNKLAKPKPETRGRPTKRTPEVIKKIEEVAALDGSIEEMAYYAGIHRETLYQWLKEDKVFSDRIMELRERPVLKARQTVVARASESYSNAMDYLKRKRRLEFGDATDITSGGKSILVQFDNAFTPSPEKNSK